MELWFWAAVGGAVFAGLSNFYFKQAASRGYDANLFSLYGGILSVAAFTLLAIISVETLSNVSYLIVSICVLGGFLNASNNIFKVAALRHIDSTIYFPLYKILAPAIAILIGIVAFQESFTWYEWVGLVLGLTVPLLLINKVENNRQGNLIAGLVLVAITGFLSAGAAGVYKYSLDSGMTTLGVLWVSSIGLFLGSLFSILIKTGIKGLKNRIVGKTSVGLVFAASARATLIGLSFFLMLYAFAKDGSFAIVQTIHSMYILIPIVLSIIFYNEHWNLQKALAIALSIAALGFFH